MYQLKCKAIALAEEARAFKKQEQREKRLLNKWKARAELGRIKAAGQGKWTEGPDPKTVSSATQRAIHLHRVNDIRKEARCALLAYGFVRGLSYRQMENFAWTQPNWARVEKLAIRYSDVTEQDVKQRFAQWKDEALGGIEPHEWQDSVQPGSVKRLTPWVQMQRLRNHKELVSLFLAGIKESGMPECTTWEYVDVTYTTTTEPAGA